MSRRLKGYVVRTSEGWYVSSLGVIRSITPNKKLRTVFSNASRAAIVTNPGDVVLPLFATRKPKPATFSERVQRIRAQQADTTPGPVVVMRCPSLDGPAPVAAAEGLYGWLDATDGSWAHVGPMPRAEAVARPNLRNRERKLVRILDDGAHEAALEAARREEREALQGRIDSLRGALEEIRDSYENGHIDLSVGLAAALAYALGEEEDAAAKGRAK